jgi:hypothetical protein
MRQHNQRGLSLATQLKPPNYDAQWPTCAPQHNCVEASGLRNKALMLTLVRAGVMRDTGVDRGWLFVRIQYCLELFIWAIDRDSCHVHDLDLIMAGCFACHLDAILVRHASQWMSLSVEHPLIQTDNLLILKD